MASLFVNKVEYCTPELQTVPEDLHGRSGNVIENVKAFIATYDDALTDDVKAAIEKGAVAFDSDLHAWGVNLKPDTLM